MEKGILILFFVALFAIVGLIFSAGTGSFGAVIFKQWATSPEPSAKAGYETLGEWVAEGWLPEYGEQNEYCSLGCGNICEKTYEKGYSKR